MPTSDYADSFIGGRGLATAIYWNEVPHNIAAFDPENRLIIVTGPLGGIPGVSGSIWQIYGKSPATAPEVFCNASLGGHWGANLKFAGYDAIVIQGKSDRPVYLFIEDGKAELRDASHLWGKVSVEVRGILKQELGNPAKIVATGPAGDNLVSFATVLAENDASGGAGFGAVMGSKRLKAIAVRGSARVTAANPEELGKLTEYVRELNRDVGMVPVTVYAKLPGVHEKKYACYGCICGCARTIAETSDGGRSKRFCNSGCFYQEPVKRYYGDYNDVVIRANRLCDEYGLDTKSVEAIIGWMSRCGEAEILTDGNTGLVLSKIGSLEFIETLVRKISLRDGFGDILALGPVGAAKYVGRGTEDLVAGTVASQGRALGFDPRTFITTGVIHAMEPRSPMWQLNEIGKVMAHWVGWAIKDVIPADGFRVGQQHPLAHRLLIDDPQALKASIDACYVSSKTLRRIADTFWGSEVAADFSTYEGKALAAKMIQDHSYAKECLILCAVVWPNLHRRYSLDHVGDHTVESKLLAAATGKEVCPEELNKIGERVFNLTRSILAREGRWGRENDILPEYCYTAHLASEAYNPGCLVPGSNGEIISKRGAMLDRKKFEMLMSEYYQLRGWDQATGLQCTKTLKELGLADVANELSQRGLAV